MQRVKIAGLEVGDGAPVFMIAEIGINHNGSLDVVKKLIDAAAEAGCQAVKFQKRTIPVIYSEAELQKPREVPADVIVRALKRGVLSKEAVVRLVDSDLRQTTNGDLKLALELTASEYAEIDVYCKTKNMLWFASPWDEDSVDFLDQFNPCCYKVASASLTDDGLLEYIRSRGCPVILSTGMSTLEQIDHAIDVLGEDDLVLLHCVSTYPAEYKELNLRVIPVLKARYDIPVGYSGHERGIHSSAHAVALGACAVERHVTLDRIMWGSDQAASIEPKGLESLVKEIRHLEEALGDGEKRLLDSEVPIMKKLRRK
ncbi:MAG: N-acetylneuraminate synthase family protein [Candidatus Harrisonbacteria bacterium]|nr:N-acetylneuraminate synthase family protein [Candidatus Harrisonbacteria bacterium]